MSKSLLLLPAVLLLLPAYLSAQDPFQGNQANPFGGRAAGADPFGGNPATADPFAQPNQKKTKRLAKPTPAAKVAVVPGDAEVRIRETLDKLTTASFVELPLRDAIDQSRREPAHRDRLPHV